MAHKLIVYNDKSQELWDDSAGVYTHTGADGKVLANRPLTEQEYSMLNPSTAKINDLAEAVDQLILEALMGGMF